MCMMPRQIATSMLQAGIWLQVLQGGLSLV